MAVQDPTIILLDVKIPVTAIESTEWFERQIGEFVLQVSLPCLHDKATDTYFVKGAIWDKWETDLVRYFISNGYSSPEIDAFIQVHALSGQR